MTPEKLPFGSIRFGGNVIKIAAPRHEAKLDGYSKRQQDKSLDKILDDVEREEDGERFDGLS